MTIYGIDLGTTYSCIAYVDDVGRPTVVKSAIGEDTTPSVVYFEAPDSVVVGRTAKNSAILFPDLVMSLIKRQMGQQVQFDFHGQSHTPETISALILKELARSAEEHTREPVKHVVITVPAYFGVGEREATRKAGEIAGLNVLNVVPEPVAAALHYEALASGGDRTILVYDLGGGTFDTIVIRLHDNDIEVVCTDGDHHLGGADWDEKIVDYLIEQFVAANPGADPSHDEGFLQDLTIAAEQLKKDLSSARTRKHGMRFDRAATQVELARETFEEITSEMLERTLQITERTVATARERGVAAFDEVLLVGGATRMPIVAQRLQERFGFDPRVIDPDLAVAKGAARFALIESVKVTQPDDAGDTEATVESANLQLGAIPELIAAVVGTSALVPFVQSLASKAAEDVYSKLRRIVSRKQHRILDVELADKDLIAVSDKVTKIVLNLPRSLDASQYGSLHTILEVLVERAPGRDSPWLSIRCDQSCGGWLITSIESPPRGVFTLNPLPPNVEPPPAQLRRTISELENERKLLRSMVQYLAKDIDLDE